MRKLLFIALLITLLGIVWYRRVTTIIPIVSNYPVEISISSGSTIIDISRQLKQKNLISSQIAFLLYLYSHQKQQLIQARNFSFREPLLSLPQLVSHLTQRSVLPVQEEKVIIIIEGKKLKDIAQQLSFEFQSSYRGDYLNDFFAAAKQSNFDYDFLKNVPKDITLEGYLFPDTYRFFVDSPPQEVIAIMLENFDRKFLPAWREEIINKNISLHDRVTLASILEREVKTFEDKKIVADLFYRRIEAGMPLQADSTVNYVTGKSDPAVLIVDTLVASPYNTYQNIGLPPGPICNPGSDSLEAAIYPKQNPYWYFLTTKDGDVIYSRTFDEHVRNKQKYLR